MDTYIWVLNTSILRRSEIKKLNTKQTNMKTHENKLTTIIIYLITTIWVSLLIYNLINEYM